MPNNLACNRNRLGGACDQELTSLLPCAMITVRDYRDPAGFHQLIAILLTEYYDRQYQHYNEQNQVKLILTGNLLELTTWLKTQ